MFMLFGVIAIMMIYLPLYFQEQGLSKTEIGVIFGVGSFVSIFSQPIWGVVSDRRNTVKRVLIALIVISAAISIGLFYLNGLLLLIIVYCAFNLFFSAIPSLTESLAVSTAERAGRGFGVIRLWGEVGLGLFSLTLGIVVSAIGLSNLIWIYVGVVLVFLVSAMFLQDAQIRSAALKSEHFVKLFTNPAFLWFLFIVLLTSIPHRMNDGLIGIYLTALGGTEQQVGRAWMVATFSSVPLLAFGAFFVRRFHPMLLISVISSLYVIRWLVFASTDNPDTLVLLQAMQGLTFPLFLVSAVFYITRIVPPELRSTGQTTYAAVFGGIAGIIGNIGGGYVLDHFAPNTIYLIGSVFSLAGAVAAGATWLRLRRSAAD